MVECLQTTIDFASQFRRANRTIDEAVLFVNVAANHRLDIVAFFYKPYTTEITLRIR
jgi:hypothetical protein